MIAGIDAPTHPSKIARELKARIGDLFDRYAFHEVLNEIGKQKPEFDIYVCPAGQKHICACGKERA